MVRLLIRRGMTWALALGLLFGGIGPSWAASVPVPMSSELAMVSDMDMPCATVLQKKSPGKSAPAKNCDGAAAICIGCAVGSGERQAVVAIDLQYRGAVHTLLGDTYLRSVALVPALRPPIDHS